MSKHYQAYISMQVYQTDDLHFDRLLHPYMGVGCVQWVRVGLVQDLGRDEASVFTASLASTSQQVPDVDSLVEAGSSFGQKNPMNKNIHCMSDCLIFNLAIP